MSEWKELKLGQVALIKNGKSRPKSKGIIPVYGGNGILDCCNEFNVSNETVIIGRVGAYCGTVYFENKNIWVSDNALFLKPKAENHTKFFYYLLKDKNLNQFAGGSSHPLLTQGRLNDLEINLPPLSTQKAIAEILSSLDDKIELNNQINQNLEALAQALFKQWFVDFEFPNENGEPYKSSGGEMIDSELGEIPKGWRVGSIYDISTVVYGAPFKSTLFNQENKGLPLIRIRDLKTFKPQYWTEEIHNKGTKINAGDLVVGMDAEFRPHFWLGQTAWLNQRLCLFKPNDGVSKLFVRETIRPRLEFFEKSSVGTTVIHLGKGDIDTFKSFVPNPHVSFLFKELTDPLFEKVISNSKETESLKTLRDTLLPKLISGELEVNESLLEPTF